MEDVDGNDSFLMTQYSSRLLPPDNLLEDHLENSFSHSLESDGIASMKTWEASRISSVFEITNDTNPSDTNTQSLPHLLQRASFSVPAKASCATLSRQMASYHKSHLFYGPQAIMKFWAPVVVGSG